ncbi:hypothetical protein GQ600_24257 [Phytophthora cactorum]|nr:hypothetical protein GQ600_24257 [Phytophthora cactorum]
MDPVSEGILFGIVCGIMVCICVKELIPTSYKFARDKTHIVAVGMLAGSLSWWLALHSSAMLACKRKHIRHPKLYKDEDVCNYWKSVASDYICRWITHTSLPLKNIVNTKFY